MLSGAYSSHEEIKNTRQGQAFRTLFLLFSFDDLEE